MKVGQDIKKAGIVVYNCKEVKFKGKKVVEELVGGEKENLDELIKKQRADANLNLDKNYR